MKRTYLSLAIGLATGLLYAVPSYAQQAAAAGNAPAQPSQVKQLDQITVTARKREETLQDVAAVLLRLRFGHAVGLRRSHEGEGICHA